MAFASLLSGGVPVSILPSLVSSIEPVPPSISGPATQSFLYTAGANLARVAVDGSVSAVATTLQTADPSVALVALTSGGLAVRVNPELVTSIEPVPTSISGPAAQSYVYTASGDTTARITVDGTVATVTALLNAALPPPVPGGGLVVASTVFVAPAPIGNDATGARQIPALPFATLAAAIAAALPGDTIELQPGTYAGAAIPATAPNLRIVGAGRTATVFSSAITWSPTVASQLQIERAGIQLPNGLTVIGVGVTPLLGCTDLDAANVVITSALARLRACELNDLTVTDANLELIDSRVNGTTTITNTDPASTASTSVENSVLGLLDTTGVSPRVTCDTASFVERWTASAITHSTAVPPTLVMLGVMEGEPLTLIDWDLPANPAGSVGDYQCAPVIVGGSTPAFDFAAPAAGAGGEVTIDFGGSLPLVGATITVTGTAIGDISLVDRSEVAFAPIATGVGGTAFRSGVLVSGGTPIAFAPGPTTVNLPFRFVNTTYDVVVTPVSGAPGADPLQVTARTQDDFTISNTNLAPILAIVALYHPAP